MSLPSRARSAAKSIVRSLGYEIRPAPFPVPPRLDEFLGTPQWHLQYDAATDPLKAFANRVARFSDSAEQTRTIRELHLAGTLKQPPPQGRMEWSGKLNVGIWRRDSDARSAVFVRRKDAAQDWNDWASRDAIEPKRTRWRVVLVGESVARGHLYDPGFTPASALEGMLASRLGTAKIDVVDLAKTNQAMAPLRTLLAQCLSLRPDVVVIFAGNNWRPQLADTDVPYVDGLLREGGVPAMKSFLDIRREQAARQFVSEANSFLAANNVATVWVVPEFNLGDWTDPVSGAPLLKADGNRRWRELEEQASLAARAGDLGHAETLAEQMVTLDGGTGSMPLRILAECRHAAGDHSESRRYLEMCRDAEGWNPSFQYSPRVARSIQGALRDGASGPRQAVVDLPEVFSRHLDGAIPDRRIFLDYCHLTAEGINVAMAEVASRIASMLLTQTIPPSTFEALSGAPPAKVEGQACLLAAVHNAHFYQRQEIVDYWLERGLRYWPEGREIISRFVDFQMRRAPAIACKSTLEMLALEEPDTLRYLSLYGKRLDFTLGNAAAKCLQVEFDDIRAREHSIRSGPRELTEFYYSSVAAGSSARDWTSSSFATNRGSRSMFASAFWKRSRFVFFADAGRPAGLELTFRVPYLAASGGEVDIEVNGQRVGQAAGSRNWRTLEVSVPGDRMADGLNEIVLTWPEQDQPSDEALGQAADMLSARQLPRFYPVFGEIHSLLVFDPPARAAECEEHPRVG